MGRQNLSFEQLTTPEQELRKLFETRDIYAFLTGKKETVSKFHFNWITTPPSHMIEIDPYSILQGLSPAPAPSANPVQRAHSEAPSPSAVFSHNLQTRNNQLPSTTPWPRNTTRKSTIQKRMHITVKIDKGRCHQTGIRGFLSKAANRGHDPTAMIIFLVRLWCWKKCCQSMIAN